MIECPCRECERRGCGAYHDKCDKYQRYNEAQREEADRRLVRVNNNTMVYDERNRMKASRSTNGIVDMHRK